jgi:hypothetical protein
MDFRPYLVVLTRGKTAVSCENLLEKLKLPSLKIRRLK